MKSFKRQFWTCLLFLLPTLVFFQNCGGTFTSNNASQLSSESLGDSTSPNLPPASASPQVTLKSKLNALTNIRNQRLEFQIINAGKFLAKTAVCKFDDMSDVDCSSLVFTMSNIADGDHKLIVTVSGQNGEILPSYAVVFRVDATVPVVSLTAVPPTVASNNFVKIEFVTNDQLSGVQSSECSFDAGAFKACVSPLNLTDLSEGNHSIAVRCYDKAGNLSLIQNKSWKVDLTAPTVNVLTKPPAFTNQTVASISFNGVDDGRTLTNFLCQLDTGIAQACQSPLNLTAVTTGPHSLSVVVIDAAGIRSAPAVVNWLVDLSPPTLPLIVSNMTQSPSPVANFSLSSNDEESGIASYQCSLDSAVFENCSSPIGYNGLYFDHNVRVKAIDKAGNISEVATVKWFSEFVPALSRIAMGLNHTCFVAADTNVKCFGLNNNGQLGSGDNELFMTSAPLTVPNTLGAIAVEAGNYSACALINDGSVRCWGRDTDRVTTVSGLPANDPVTNMSMAEYGTNFVTASGKVYQLGQGTATLVTAGAVPDTALLFTDGQYVRCSITKLGALGCFNYYEIPSVEYAKFGKVISFSSGLTEPFIASETACAVTDVGAVKCAGPNAYGQNGNGTRVSTTTPTLVSQLVNVKLVSAGRRHVCALLQNGTVSCWGSNYFGQLGNTNPQDSLTPVTVPGLSNITSLRAGPYSTCAMDNANNIKCWGSQRGYQTGAVQRSFGLLGSPYTTAIVKVDLSVTGTVLTSAAPISVGRNELKITSNGSLCLYSKDLPGSALECPYLAPDNTHTCNSDGKCSAAFSNSSKTFCLYDNGQPYGCFSYFPGVSSFSVQEAYPYFNMRGPANELLAGAYRSFSYTNKPPVTFSISSCPLFPNLAGTLVFVEAPKLTAQSLHTICGGSGTGIAYEQLGIGGYNGYAYYPVY